MAAEPLIDHAIIARDDIPKALADRIVALLTSLRETTGGGGGQAMPSVMSITM